MENFTLQLQVRASFCYSAITFTSAYSYCRSHFYSRSRSRSFSYYCSHSYLYYSEYEYTFQCQHSACGRGRRCGGSSARPLQCP